MPESKQWEYTMTANRSKVWIKFVNGASVTIQIRVHTNWSDAVPTLEVIYVGPPPQWGGDTVQLPILKLKSGVFVRDHKVGEDVAPRIFFYGIPDATNAAMASGVSEGFLAFVSMHRSQIELCAVEPERE